MTTRSTASPKTANTGHPDSEDPDGDAGYSYRLADLKALLRYRLRRQWARVHVQPNMARWNHPGGLVGLVVDGQVDLARVPLPDTLPHPQTRDPLERQELDLLEAFPQIGTAVDPDAPHPGPGWARARWPRGFIDPDVPEPEPPTPYTEVYFTAEETARMHAEAAASPPKPPRPAPRWPRHAWRYAVDPG